MDKTKLIELVEEVLETEETLSADTVLEDIEEWDSLGKLALMAMVKKEFNVNLTAPQVRDFVTVNDICAALEN